MKKNKVFVNKISKKINNNQGYCNIDNINNNSIVIDNDDIIETNNDENNLTVREKIDNLLNRNGYIFNVDVKIITSNREYNTKIATKIGDRIITLDNNIININDIKELIIKN